MELRLLSCWETPKESRSVSHSYSHIYKRGKLPNYDCLHGNRGSIKAKDSAEGRLPAIKKSELVSRLGCSRMDSSDETSSGQTGPWTDEMHVHFLNSMEASFVRTMLRNNINVDNNHHHGNNGGVLRLDRPLPDSSQSTLDLKSNRRKKQHAAPSPSSSSGPGNRTGCRNDKRTRRVVPSSSSSQLYDPSQDQVVPQLVGDSSGAKDERDRPT